jgi:hypothetical protein
MQTPPIHQTEEKIMAKSNVLVSITASREKDEIVYKLDAASTLTNEELEYYLEEIIKGICTWKPGLCSENVKTLKGTIKKKK